MDLRYPGALLRRRRVLNQGRYQSLPRPHICILARWLHHAQTGLRRFDLGNPGSPDASRYGL